MTTSADIRRAGRARVSWFNTPAASGSSLNFANYIAGLEHDGNDWVPAIAPLGKDPDHCPRCRTAAAAFKTPYRPREDA